MKKLQFYAPAGALGVSTPCPREDAATNFPEDYRRVISELSKISSQSNGEI
jgi:hypothetical protein